MTKRVFHVGLIVAVLAPTLVHAQAVCLPAPRLLTTMPMGGQVGTQLELTITGQHLEEIAGLHFSHPGIVAAPVLDKNGQPVANRFSLTIAPDCPLGLHEARVMTRLGVSSSRVFSVGDLQEVNRSKANTSLETAVALPINSICNAAMTRQAIDYYTFVAAKGQRVIVDCGAQGIESKLKPVVIVADAEGNDLLVERRGGVVDFTAPAEATYSIKVHDLTYSGGAHYFYRLALRELKPDVPVTRLPSVTTVNSVSWPPASLNDDRRIAEMEPNNKHDEAQQITLPCDISGRFFPAADVDTFEFQAKKGEVWWVEVASQRLGRPTDPSVVVQLVTSSGESGAKESLTDVAELADIASPVKVSSNGYSYDGPPYNVGSTDVLGKFEAPQDGLYRLQVRDLFGGTRTDPQNIYRLIVRKAQPDFAIAAWAVHMELRNGDRNALSKPVALRGGATMALEVVAVRRDGFAGEIQLSMDNLPDGVTATGLKIAAGKSRGMMLISAAEGAPRGLTSATFVGRAMIDDKVVERPCRLASMQWPVPNAWSEIPSPRLLADVPISVSDSETAPITIAAESKIWEVTEGETLNIPLTHTRRSEFSGPKMTLKTYGCSFEGVPAFEIPLTADHSEAKIDLASLKTPPGDYVIAFYGSAVARYRYNPAAVLIAEVALKESQQRADAAAVESNRLSEAAKQAPPEKKADAEKSASEAAARTKAANDALAAAKQRLNQAKSQAQPRDIVDIIVSKPITIRVNPAEKK